ncbi:MAG: Gfo/Idh/MocA family oxidoreductase [Clostridiaceae bacterium]|nr:Gfo/Idh/MocA family oxidoreductase [Clostridiaceae bacterium]
MKIINFAIVGFGSIAKTHALASFDANLRFNFPFALNLKYVVTRKPQEIRLINTKVSMDLEEVLRDESVDFISICSPNDSHLELVERAVKYKKAIYCEKPLSSNYEDAERMAKLIKDNNIKAAVALMYRFLPAVRLLKKELERETIGEIIDFKIKTYHKSYLSEKKAGSWRTLQGSGGGALLDLGVHLIDLIHFTLGAIEKVKANTRIFFKERDFVDEIAFCEFQLANGVMGSLEVSRIFAESDERDSFEIFGTKGSFKINVKKPHELEFYDCNTNNTLLINPGDNSEELLYYPDDRNLLGFFQSAHTASLMNFANSVYEGKDTGIAANFEDALKCQRVIEMAYSR